MRRGSADWKRHKASWGIRSELAMSLLGNEEENAAAAADPSKKLGGSS